jgi:hypothetical protein
LATKHTKEPHSEFLNLPKNNKYCSAVDVEFGKFYQCSLCGIVHVRKDQNRSFTIGRWKEHETSKTHLQAIAREEERERNEAKKEAGNIDLSKLERNFLAQKAKKQTTVLSFFVKKKNNNPPANLTMPDGNASSCTSSHVSVALTTDGNEPAAVTDLVSIVSTSKSPHLNTCQGIVPKFRDTEFQLNLAALSLNGVLSGDSSFMISSFGQWQVIRATACNGSNGSIRKDKAYQCDSCFAIRSDNIKLRKIRDKIQKRGISFRMATDIVNTVYSFPQLIIVS